MPLVGVFVLYSAFFQYCSTVHVPQDIKTTSETQTWEKKASILTTTTDEKKNMLIFFFFTEALKATDLSSFQSSGQKKSHAFFFSPHKCQVL